MNKPPQTTMSQETTTPKTKSRRGRKLSSQAGKTDPTGCVMHHVRIHESLDAIVREIIMAKGISFRDASEQSLIAWAKANGVKISTIEVEVSTPKIESRFIVAD